MADIAVPYTLSGPGGTIVFNNGDLHTSDDLYWISNITGLDGAPLRTPQNNKPVSDGGLIHTFWKGARHIVIEGTILVQSVPCGSSMQTIRNQMEEALLDVLDGIYQADGTLAFTPLGLSAKSLAVRQEVPCEFGYENEYQTKSFSFGLVAAIPDY